MNAGHYKTPELIEGNAVLDHLCINQAAAIEILHKWQKKNAVDELGLTDWDLGIV